MSDLRYEDGTPIPLKFTHLVYTYPSAQVYSKALYAMLETNNYSGRIWVSKDEIAKHIQSSGIIKQISTEIAGRNFRPYIKLAKYPNLDYTIYLPAKIGLRRTMLERDINNCLDNTMKWHKTCERVWVGVKEEKEILKHERAVEEVRKVKAYIKACANDSVSYDVDFKYMRSVKLDSKYTDTVKTIQKNTKSCPTCDVKITCGQNNPNWRGIRCKECREKVCMACGAFTKNCKGHKCNCQSSRCYNCSGYVAPRTVHHSHSGGGGGGGGGMGLGMGMLMGAGLAGGFG